MTWIVRKVVLFIICFQKHPSQFVTDAFVITNANTNKSILTHCSSRKTKTFSELSWKNFDRHSRYFSTVPKRKTILFASAEEQEYHDINVAGDEEFSISLNFLQESRLDSAMSNALFRTNILMKMSSSMDKDDESIAAMDEDENENNDRISGNVLDTIQNLVRHCQDSVYASKSTIPNAGQGLFAKQDIPPGTIVSFYPVHALGVNINGESFTVTQHEEDQQYFESTTNGDNYLLYLIGDRPIISTDKTILKEVQGQPFINVNPNKKTKATEDNCNTSSSAWLCHFINDGAIISENTEKGVIDYYKSTSNRQNCLLLPFGPSPLCVATSTKPISKGDELFVSYGSSYWLDALVGESEEWTEKTDDIRSFEYDMFNLIMGGIEHIHDVYAKENEALYTLFDILD